MLAEKLIMERYKAAFEFYSDESANTVDQIEDQLTPTQVFLQDQNNCCLCGTELNFKHQIDHLALTIIEDAKCDECHISLRTRSHSLQ